MKYIKMFEHNNYSKIDRYAYSDGMRRPTIDFNQYELKCIKDTINLNKYSVTNYKACVTIDSKANDMDLDIYKLDDEYYYVELYVNGDSFSMKRDRPYTNHYKCDQLEGLLQYLKDNLK